MASANLSAHRLREVLEYDPDSGTFRWLVTVGSRAKAGDVAGYSCESGYIRIRVDGKSYRSHRLAWLYMTGHWPRDQIDHIDRNTSNNAFANLREADHAQNQKNKMTHLGASGLRGVYKRGRRYRAVLLLGTFDTMEQAREAHERAAALLVS